MEVRDLVTGYGSGKALTCGVTFSLAAGECVLLAGPNGSGKTTLLRTLAGLLPPLGGSMDAETDGDGGRRDGALTGPVAESGGITETGRRVVLLPTGIPKVKGFTVRGFIRTACYRESDWKGALSPETEERMAEALTLLGIETLADQDISTLSDGQFQLACIASALTRKADILLLDEPTAFLDVENRRILLRSLRDLTRSTGLAVVFSSHDLHESLQVADRVFAFSAEGRFFASESTPESREAVLAAVFPENA